MPIDPNIALGYKNDGLSSISNMLNLANSAQTYKTNNIALQAQDQANNERKNVIQLMQSDPSLRPAADGTFDLSEQNLAKIQQAAPQTFNEVIGRLAQTNSQMTNARQSIQSLGNETANVVARTIKSLADKSPAERAAGMSVLADSIPQTKPLVERYLHTVQQATMGLPESATPDQKREALSKIDNFWTNYPLTQEQQQSVNTPTLQGVNTGQNQIFFNIKPGVQGMPMGAPVARFQNQLPVGTPTMGGPTGTTPGVIGPAPDTNFPTVTPQVQNQRDQERLRILQSELAQEKDPANRIALQREIQNTQQGIQQRSQIGQQGGFHATGLPAGAEKNIQSNVEEMTRHYSSLQDQATANQLVQSLTGNIKALAPSAATGTLAGRQSYTAGLLNALGIKSTGDLKTDSDLLEKNMSQLNLGTPASTDAARTLVAASRPHSSMSETAIIEAADQVAAQIKANVAVRNFLTPYKYGNNGQGDAQGYQQARQTIEQVADPRVWQYESIPADQPSKDPRFKTARQEFLGKLNPDDRKKLVEKAQVLTNMGMFK